MKSSYELREFAVDVAVKIVGHKGSTELVLSSADEIVSYIYGRPMTSNLDKIKQKVEANVL